ncbi:hypothetical protein [Streptomyces sp. GbtcB6]|uniref:hypothetical protein n=1 Tax=Streptomyces sp. GbtcB6 TaxID=2824751 RepID=UPI001C306A35|nr:hypothetical protein [Streptomyces sp. GbtcB6]
MPADAKSPKKLRSNRAALTHKTGYALRHPGRVGYYRAVMASDTRRSPEAAVGSQTHDRWLALGQMQFDHLVEHGLRPEVREDFSYRTETLLDLAQRHGLHTRFMEDWEKRPHGRSRIRVSRSPLPTA